MEGVRVESVEFRSGGLRIAGDLFSPEGLENGSQRPAVVVVQGFTHTKEARHPQCEFFSRAGYVTLCIDFRCFGASEGEPREQLFPLWEVEDVRNAISYLQTRPEVDADRIGIWGTSFGGGIVLGVGAFDRRAKVVISENALDGRRWVRAIRTTEQWEELLDRLDADRARRFAGEPSERIPRFGHGSAGVFCAAPSHRAMIEEGLAIGMPMGPEADMPLESLEKIIEFNPFSASVIQRIAPRPLLMVGATNADIVHPIEHILEAFNVALEPKRFIGLHYDTMGLYFEPGLSESLRVALDFLEEMLPM